MTGLQDTSHRDVLCSNKAVAKGWCPTGSISFPGHLEMHVLRPPEAEFLEQEEEAAVHELLNLSMILTWASLGTHGLRYLRDT